MTTPREFWRRSNVAVLIVIAAAVAILVVLGDQTSQLLEQITDPDAIARIERLVVVEAACVILLLSAVGLGLRHAINPAYQRLQRTVEALEESESRSRAVLDSMDEGMLLTEASGRLLAWNRSAVRLLGVDPDAKELMLQDLSRELVDEHGAPWPIEELPSRITMRTGQSLSDVVIGVRVEGGTLRWMSVNTHPLFRGADTQAHAAVSIFRDVTIQRRAEEERAAHGAALEMQNRELLEQKEALEHGQALYRSLVDTAGSAIVGVDRSGVVFEWNREAENLYGIPRAEAIGRDYMNELVTPRYRERMREGMTALLAGKTIRNVVAPLRTRDGLRRTVLWNMAPLRAGPNMPVHGVIAVGLDITERDASDERFRVLFERSSDAHLLYDDTGILDCNDATLRLLRYSRKESVIGKTPVDLSPRRQPDGRLSLIVGQQMRQLARLRGYNRFEWVHQRGDGTSFPVEVTLTPVRLHGRDVILAVWHDISEQKKVEEALRAAKDAAESANRTKSEFMTRMNHELRTPLTAIIGFSRVLMQGKEGSLSAGARNYVERIRVNGMHLLSLINQILDVAKVEAGRMDLDPELVQVDVLVRETLAMLETTAESKGLVMRGEIPARVAPYVTDAGKLRQILINLVGNAVKFTQQGEVCVRVQVDPITAKPTAIQVQDTGIGIPRERHDKVFEPFEQGDSSTRREFGGTGLGLSIVKTFAELIGARVQLDSEVGKGTTFTLRLAPEEAKALPKKASA